MCFYSDGGSVEMWEKHVLQARKVHRCEGCNEKIPKGALYRLDTGRFEGEFFRTPTCGKCELTTFRIHLHELAEGCDWHESWCPISELKTYCDDTDFEWSTDAEGQWHLRRQRERETVAE